MAISMALNSSTVVTTTLPLKRLLGDQVQGTVSNNISAGTAVAFQTTALAGMVTHIRVYVGDPAPAKLVAGIYKDNGNSSSPAPSARLVQGTLTSPVANAWNTVLLPATEVTANTKYWVAILNPWGKGTLYFTDKSGSGVWRQTSGSNTLGTLPDPWTGSAISGPGLSAYGAGY